MTRGVAGAHDVRRRGAGVDIGEEEEALDVVPGRPGERGEPRVVPVGVHGLFVVGEAGVLGRRLRLVDADVGRRQRALREVDDRRVHGETVERGGAGQWELARPAVLLGTEARTVRRPRVDLVFGCGTAEPPLGLALGVGVVRLGRREEAGQVGGDRGVDLVGRDEALEDDPAVVTPGFDLFVTRETGSHAQHDTARGYCPVPARSRASRATRRASWSGTGVRAASLDAARTVCAAVSGVVRQPACATTGRAPVRVQTQYPTHRPSSTRGVRAPRRASGSGPCATSGCWVTPTVGMPVTAPRWTASPARRGWSMPVASTSSTSGVTSQRERGDRGGEHRTLPTREQPGCVRRRHALRGDGLGDDVVGAAGLARARGATKMAVGAPRLDG